MKMLAAENSRRSLELTYEIEASSNFYFKSFPLLVSLIKHQGKIFQDEEQPRILAKVQDYLTRLFLENPDDLDRRQLLIYATVLTGVPSVLANPNEALTMFACANVDELMQEGGKMHWNWPKYLLYASTRHQSGEIR